MSLFGLLGMAARTMGANTYGLDVTGQNLANLNTVGYSRRVVDFGAVPPADARTSAGQGVEILGVRGIRDAMFDRRLFQETPHQGREQAIVDAMSVIEVALGKPGESLDARLGQFFSAWSGLADAPTDPVKRSQVAAQGQALASDFASMAQRLSSSRTDADNKIRNSVEEINALTAQIASLNSKIQSAGPAGSLTLKDEQIQAVQKLSTLVDIQTNELNDGTMQVQFAAGRPLVVGETAYKVDIVNQPVTGLARLSYEGTDITAAVTSGSVAGLLYTRDTLIPEYKNRLDTLAYSVVTEVNSRHDAGYTLAGTDAPPFFNALGSATDAASLMSMNAAVVADHTLIAAGGVPGTPGDNQTARSLAGLRDTKLLNGNTATFNDFWGQLVNRAGQDGRAAKSELASRSQVVTQIANLRDAVSGVNMDEETANLMKFSRAYDANARYFSVVNDILGTLMNIGR